MEITLNTPKTVVVARAIAEKTAVITKIELISITDIPNDRVVAVVKIPNMADRELILWEGVEYDSIGDWTQEQANSRIIELL